MARYSLGFFFAILIPSAVFAYFATDLVVLIFGAEYRESGRLLSILVFYLASVWSTLPFTIAAQATDNEDLLLKIRAAMAFSGVVLKTVGYLMYGLFGVAWCTVIIWVFGGLATCILPFRAMKRQGRLRFRKTVEQRLSDDD
jgi:O-antigen/teichoic acid export membrane protein